MISEFLRDKLGSSNSKSLETNGNRILETIQEIFRERRQKTTHSIEKTEDEKMLWKTI